MSAMFQIFRHENLYSFNFFNGRGQLLMIGGNFSSLDDAEKTVEAVRGSSSINQRFVSKNSENGDSFFVIKDAIGQDIANSHLFQNQKSYTHTLNYVKNEAREAKLITSVNSSRVWNMN